MNTNARPWLDLMQTVIEYRHDKPTRDQLNKAARQSMLHVDVLFLTHHLSRICDGAILEIGSFIGGSTIAAALGVRTSGVVKPFISIEPGGRLKGHKLATRNIFKTLTKNLTRFGVLDLVTLINATAEDEATLSRVRQTMAPGTVGFFIFDAHSNVAHDLDLYGDRLKDGCWVMIDDYFGPSEKAGPTQAQVLELVARGRLVPLGFYGWGTWFGQWRGTD